MPTLWWRNRICESSSLMTTLYRKHADGQIGTWTISYDPTGIITMTTRRNQDASPVTHDEVVSYGKAGRTLRQQIESRVQSRINSKLDNGYKRTLQEAESGSTNTLELPRPMLASTGTPEFSSMFIQPKLDGMRMIVHRTHDDEFLAYTRQGKLLKTVDHILEQLPLYPGQYIDGELYIHGVSLQRIMSLAKREQADNVLLEYHVFDIVEEGIPFHRRFTDLSRQAHGFGPNVKLVTTIGTKTPVADFQRFREAGYEGAILRDGDGFYAAGKRSKQLIKMKHFIDEEYLCTDVTTGERGIAVLVCETAAGQTFRVTAPGNAEQRKSALERPDLYVGQYVTVKHAGLTPYGIPFHPVCLGIK